MRNPLDLKKLKLNLNYRQNTFPINLNDDKYPYVVGPTPTSIGLN